MLSVAVPGAPTELNVTQRLPTMLILYAEKPIEDGGMPVIAYRVQYDNKTLHDFDITKGLYFVDTVQAFPTPD